MMKKTLFLLLVSTLLMSGCIKTDDRDQFEGSYLLNVSGYLKISYGDESKTIPISDENQALSITKVSSSDNIVSVSGYYNSNAEVTGNSIQIDSEIQSGTTSSGITMSLTITHKTGTLSGSSLSFASDITGNAYYQGYTFPLNGTVNNIAYKQQ